MALRDFIRERAVLWSGGRRFTMQKPTVGAVHLFLTLMHPEVRLLLAIARAASVAGKLDEVRVAWTSDPATMAAGVLLGTEDGRSRLTHVLAQIVDSDAPPEVWPLVEILRAALRMLDLPRVARSLGVVEFVTGPDPQPDAGGAAEAEEQAVHLLASRMNVLEPEILVLPYEAFCTLLERMANESRPAVADAAHLRALSEFGVGYETAKGESHA